MKELMLKIVMSSKDPKKVGLTVRGMLVGLIPLVTAGLSLSSGGIIDPGVVATLVENIIGLVEQGATLVSAVMIFLGAFRKLWFTLLDIYIAIFK